MNSANDIAEDLRHFADPYTEVTVEPVSEDVFTATWLSKRRRLSATLRLLEGELQVDYRGATLSYSAFLSHEDLGNLNFLGENTVAQFRSLKRAIAPVDTEAARGPITGAAHAILQAAIRDHVSDGTTHVLFLAAQGGAGKTKVLERLVLDGARRFVAGQSTFLYLYVNAQGRALAQVDEAFAVELDLLGSPMSFSAVAALTRAGALIPVIDGFDELIGAVGYDEAFQSLGRFLDALAGAGQIVAAARSTYYEREFQARVRVRPRRDLWTLDTVTLIPWKVEQVVSAFTLVEEEHRASGHPIDSATSSSIRHRLRNLEPGLSEFLGRPFFAVQAVRALASGEELRGEGDLLQELTQALLRREVSEKFLDKNRTSMTTVPLLWSFLREVAAEMWFQQTRALDGPSIDAVISVATDGWTPIGVDRLRERVKDLPVFIGAEGGRVEFAHEYFFALFLAETLQAAVGAGGYALENALGRGLLPEGVAGEVTQRTTDVPAALRALNQASSSEALRSAVVRENAGSLAASMLSDRPNDWKIELQRMVFGNVGLGGDFALFDCLDCLFRHTDLSRLRVKAGNWSTAQLELPVFRQGETRLHVTGMQVGANVRGLRLLTDEGAEDVWEPRRVEATLRDLGAALPKAVERRQVSEARVAVVQKLARAFLKSVFVATEDDVNGTFMKDSEWPEVCRALEATGLISGERRATSGRGKIFYRCQVDPDDLMAGLSPDAKVSAKIHSFWDAIASVRET